MSDTPSRDEKPELYFTTLDGFAKARQALTEQQCRNALAFIEGYAPDALMAALRQVNK